jgi:type I restriction enzyme S subunit
VSKELPQGWIEATIDEINLHKSQNITPSDFPEEEFELFSVPIFPTGKPENLLGKDIGSSKQVVSPGDVLLCKINPRINRVWTVGEKTDLRQIASSEWINVRNPLICANYLKYAFSRKDFRELLCSEVAGVGGSLTRAQPKKVEKYTVPIAPLNEQIRIANKLDSVLAKVDAAQTRLEKIPALLKRFRQSVLAAASSGELTKEWVTIDADYYRKIHKQILAAPKSEKLSGPTQDEIADAKRLFGNPEWGRWKFFVLEQLVEQERGIPYGVVQTGEAQAEGIPTVRCGDVKPFKILEDDLKNVDPAIEKNYSRTRLKGGEILLAIRGTVGNAAVVSQRLANRNANISREVAMIPIIHEVDPYFILMLLQSPGGFRCLAEKVRGVAQKGINLADVRRFVTPLPSLEEQKEIVRRVESLLTLADTVEKQYLETKKRIDRLTQSLLAKAFRGELVPQDPNDEPAAELLKRIQAERNAQPPVKNKRAKSA